MSNKPSFDQKGFYEIRVSGKLDRIWAEWFDGFQMIYKENETILNGVVQDQAALFGLLTKLNNLGLQLLSVQRTR
jgi:hypothetical protein